MSRASNEKPLRLPLILRQLALGGQGLEGLAWQTHRQSRCNTGMLYKSEPCAIGAHPLPGWQTAGPGCAMYPFALLHVDSVALSSSNLATITSMQVTCHVIESGRDGFTSVLRQMFC